MSKNETTSAVIDSLLKFLVTGSTLSVAILAPNAIRMLDSPLQTFFDKLDERDKRRKLQQLASYMKGRGLLNGEYQHGMIITNEGRRRAKRADYERLAIAEPANWDCRWRLVMFDIPEPKHAVRALFTYKLRLLGYQPLQQSVWIHPFPSREAIQTVAAHLDIVTYITYIETAHIDHQEKLQQRFRAILSNK